MDHLAMYAVVAAAIFGVNLIPAFGPPTWAVLVLFRIHGDYQVPALVLTGALSAAGGRLVLAMATRRLGRYLPERRRRNLDAVGELIARRRSRSIAALALFALSPAPSAQLFEAAGLMTIRLVPLTAAFFAGRLVSYSLYVGGASALSRTDTGKVLLSSLTSPWSVAVQVLMIAALVALARVDWLGRLRGRQSP